MAQATRLVVPLRQSPLVTTPGKLVSSASGSRCSFQLANFATAGPVNTKPLSSRANSGGRKSVLGLAPMKMNRPVVSSRTTFSVLVAQMNGSDVFRALDGGYLRMVANLDLRICHHP